jgi:hypothetical protein
VHHAPKLPPTGKAYVLLLLTIKCQRANVSCRLGINCVAVAFVGEFFVSSFASSACEVADDEDGFFVPGKARPIKLVAGPTSAGCYDGAQLRGSWYSAEVNGGRD